MDNVIALLCVLCSVVLVQRDTAVHAPEMLFVDIFIDLISQHLTDGGAGALLDADDLCSPQSFGLRIGSFLLDLIL